MIAYPIFVPTAAPEREISSPERIPEQPSERPSSPPAGRRRLAVVAAAGVALILALLVLLAAGKMSGLLPQLQNPFSEQRVDRSQPALLKTLEDLSTYRAAAGNYQVIVDVQEKVAGIPSTIKGQRVLFVAAGSVDAEVDFSSLSSDAVVVSGRSVSIGLPHARLSEPRLDMERSYVFERDRGLVDRLGSVFSSETSGDRELYLLAEKRLAAAAEQSSLVERAEQNTRSMLTGMLQSLGFTDVTVNFR